MVISDIMMPVMDGPATIQVLVRINPNVKVIAASGMAAQGSLVGSEGGNVKRFLPKPYTAETLLKTLATVIHGAPDGEA